MKGSNAAAAAAAKQLEKKLRRQKLEELERTRQQRRRSANFDAEGKPKDILLPLQPFAKFDRNDLTLDIVFAAPDTPSWTPELSKWAFDLTKTNMQAIYDAAADWGWKDGKKRAELNDAESRYIVAMDRATKMPMAFISFRFLMEDHFDVLYVYELQLSPEVQRKGLGKHMMQIMELAARKNGMQMVMLTVLKNNRNAFDFYTNKMKYSYDATSPAMNDMEASHEILSKIIDPVAYAAVEAMFEGEA